MVENTQHSHTHTFIRRRKREKIWMQNPSYSNKLYSIYVYYKQNAHCEISVRDAICYSLTMQSSHTLLIGIYNGFSAGLRTEKGGNSLCFVGVVVVVLFSVSIPNVNPTLLWETSLVRLNESRICRDWFLLNSEPMMYLTCILATIASFLDCLLCLLFLTKS